MAHHVWTVACRGSSTDKESNVISLFQAVEMLTLDPEAVKELSDNPNDGSVAIRVDLELVTRWTRDDPSVPEKSSAVVHLLGPGEVNLIGNVEYPINLDPFANARVRSFVTALPFTGFGRYWFVTCELIQPSEANPNGNQREVSRVPLDILDKPLNPQDEVSGEG